MVVARDSSGNGNDGRYDTHAAGGGGRTRFTSGLVPGDLALVAGSDPGGTAVAIPVADLDWNSDFSIEFWIKGPDNAGDWDFPTVFGARSDPPVTPPGAPRSVLTVSVDAGASAATIKLGTESGPFWGVGAYETDECVPYDGDPHHIVITYDYIAIPHGLGVAAGDVVIYVDGASQTLTDDGTVTGPNGVPPPFSGAGIAWEFAAVGLEFVASVPINGLVLDEFALYDHVLSSGDVSAHFSAASFAAYEAAVLSDSPFSYYHLNERLGGWHIGRMGVP